MPFATHAYEKPDEGVSPKEKAEKKYGLKAAKYTYYASKDNSHMFYDASTRYQIGVDYFQGNQSVDQYKKRLNAVDKEGNSWLNLDWTIRNYATKYIDIVVDKLNQQQYDPTFD